MTDPAAPAAARSPRVGRSLRQESLRRHNLALALRHVVDAPGPVSRADLAAATGITRATASALVDRLVAARLVTELAPVAAARAGRPAVPLVPARGTVVALGCEVNVDYLGVRAVDLAGQVVAERLAPGDLRGSRPETVLAELASLAEEVLTGLERPADGAAAEPPTVVGACLALPGLVDSGTGPLRLAPNLGWRDLDVLEILSAGAGAGAPALPGPPGRTFRPRLANEADLAARTEAHARRGSPSSFVYVSGEIGIGAALVLDGRLFEGRHGWGGEIGHLVLAGPDEVDPPTLEHYAGQEALLVAAGLDRHDPVATLAERARTPGQARDAVARAGRALGRALANVVHVVDVEHVVLGGIYAGLAEHLVPVVEAELAAHVISAPWARVDVSVATGGPYPAMTGGALWVLEDVLADPAALVGPASDDV